MFDKLKLQNKVFVLLPCLLLVLFFSGCVTLSTFQGPETLQQGKTVTGGGITMTVREEDDDRLPSYELFARYGVTENFDVGLKVAGIFTTVGFDLKYRFLDSTKLMGSFDMAFSYASLEDDDSVLADNTFSVYGFYPALILGTEKAYFGPKLVYLVGRGDFDDFIMNDERLPSKKVIPGLFAGYKIKLFGSLKAIPEITLYYTPDYGLWLYGGLALEI